jgi:imidazole glycerol-phosphate synthase subunit HisF
VALAERYEADGADEIVYLDISASAEERATLLDVARRTAERLFIPLTIGGGIRSADDVARALRAGADKVGINTAAVQQPSVLSECAERFGAQCVVASIDAKRDGEMWRVFTHGGRTPTELNAVEWAQECVRRGAGEILLTSIDRDGARTGYDLELTSAIADAVHVPVIASGGAGSAADVCDAISRGRADAALVAGIVHDGVTTVQEIKRTMHAHHIPTRAA